MMWLNSYTYDYTRGYGGTEDCRFKVGDVVIYDRDEYYGGIIGTICGVRNTYAFYDCIEYLMTVQDDDNVIVVDEDHICLVTLKDAIESNVIYEEPAFQIGDVVSYTNDIYVISDLLNMIDREDSKYLYQISSISSDGRIITCEGSALEYLYHDNVWKEYFTDTAHNGLPEWEDEENSNILHYKYYITLPSASVKHILSEYTIDGRSRAVYASNKNLREIRETFRTKFDIKERELAKITESLETKIYNRNREDIDPDFKSKVNDRSKFNFTEQELLLASEIDRLDSVFGFHREHYPVEMTEFQIMKSIKEAYHNAKRTGRTKILAYEKDSIKGSGLFEGVAKNGLRIQFWYNFDQSIIETAYPIGRSSNTRKH